MKNPFLKKVKGFEYFYINQNCSINRVSIAKMPISNIDDDIEGKEAGEIFSTREIIDYIKKYKKELNIDKSVKENDFPKEVSRCLMNGTIEEKHIAESIVKKFGHRLGVILLVLKTGLEENKNARDDWNEEHWEYYKNIENIILVGGLSNGIFGEKLKEYALEVFEMADCIPYNIVLFTEATHLGISGCKKFLKNKKDVNIIFDFGQTFLKRSIVLKDKDIMLNSIPSKFMECGTIKGAEELHKYLLSVIKDTYDEAKKYGKVGDELIISIANYTVAGTLNSIRGGYAKLSSLSENYADYLQMEIQKMTQKVFKVTLIHDATAAAVNFDNYKSTVCMTIGTAFGVGCPDIWENNINLKK